MKSDANVGRSNVLSLIKLIKSGLLLFTFPTDHSHNVADTGKHHSSHNVADTVANIIQSLDSGSLKSPLGSIMHTDILELIAIGHFSTDMIDCWCHRIFPIQATCTLNEKELSTVVSKLVIRFVNAERNKLVRSIKFAVGYNRRGVEETKMKGSKATSSDSDAIALLDRNTCFKIVAGVVKDAISDSVVDLKCTELSILVEMLPLSRVPPNGSLVVGVSVLPFNLVSTKPKLCVKALVSDKKKCKGKKSGKDSTVRE